MPFYSEHFIDLLVKDLESNIQGFIDDYIRREIAPFRVPLEEYKKERLVHVVLSEVGDGRELWMDGKPIAQFSWGWRGWSLVPRVTRV